MPLEIVNPPILAYEAVRSRLTDLAAASAFGTPSLRRSAPESLALSTPHRIAILPADAIGPRMSLRSAAIRKGWRFLVLSGTDVIATADTVLTKGGEHRFGHINEGPFVAGTEQAVRRAEADERIKKARFEILYLMVPALHVLALWLRELDGDADQLMVIPPTPPEFRPFEMLATNNFVTKLDELARHEMPGRDDE